MESIDFDGPEERNFLTPKERYELQQIFDTHSPDSVEAIHFIRKLPEPLQSTLESQRMELARVRAVRNEFFQILGAHGPDSSEAKAFVEKALNGDEEEKKKEEADPADWWKPKE